jgi:lipopolysaccharide export system protein LptA
MMPRTQPKRGLARAVAAAVASASALAALVAVTAVLAPPAMAAPAGELQTTVVESAGGAEMNSTETQTVTTFHTDVVATSNNIRITCDYLKIVVNRRGNPGAILGKNGKFESLLAVGHVHILQSEREATCGRAEVFPGEDRMVLSQGAPDEPLPTVRSTDGNYSASGPRMVFYRGQERAVIETLPGERAHILLPPLKNMGFAPALPETKPADGAARAAPAPTQAAAANPPSTTVAPGSAAGPAHP